MTYQLFLYDLADKLVGIFDLACDSDRKALALLDALEKVGPAELWSGLRLVRRYEPGELCAPLSVES